MQRRRRIWRRLSLRGSAWGKRKGHTARNTSDRQTADLLLIAKICSAVARSYTSRAVMSRGRRKRRKRSRTKLTRRRERVRPNTKYTAKARQRCAVAAADSVIVIMALVTARHNSKADSSDDSSAAGHSPRCLPEGHGMPGARAPLTLNKNNIKEVVSREFNKICLLSHYN